MSYTRAVAVCVFCAAILIVDPGVQAGKCVYPTVPGKRAPDCELRDFEIAQQPNCECCFLDAERCTVESDVDTEQCWPASLPCDPWVYNSVCGHDAVIGDYNDGCTGSGATSDEYCMLVADDPCGLAVRYKCLNRQTTGLCVCIQSGTIEIGLLFKCQSGSDTCD